MAQTAAHLVDHVIPPVPVRQWVISVPKRLRWFLAERSEAVAALTTIFVSEVERLVREAAGVAAAPTTADSKPPRIGAISFLHRFGSALNRHVHLHVCVTDGVFQGDTTGDTAAIAEPAVAFQPARPITLADLDTLTERVRRRLIRWFKRARLLDAEAASNMLAWDHSGFSIDASVRISLDDRDVPSYTKSLEHLVRYCARPAFALERLTAIGGGDGRPEKVRYTLPRHKRGQWIGPGRQEKATAPDAQGVVTLSPHDFLDRLADLVPPPRRHRHRYHGVFAPNHPLRAAVTARAIGNVGKSPAAAGQPGQPAGGADTQPQKRSHDTSCIAWAKLLARIAEAFPLVCPACGGDIRLIAFRLLSECETLHGLRTLCSPPAAAVLLSAIGGRPPAGAGPLRTGGSQAGEGQDGFASVKSSRHRCHPPGVHPRTGMSSFRPMTIVTSCRPRPTSFPRSTSTHSETPAASDARAGLRPRRNQALARGRRGPESATIAGSEGPHRGEPADHPPADACGSAVGRPILYWGTTQNTKSLQRH